MGTAIQQLGPAGDGLEITWADGTRRRFPWLSLRELCACTGCRHPETLQRLVDITRLPGGLHAGEATVIEDGAALRLTWLPEDHVSRFQSDFLYDLAQPPAQLRPESPWDAGNFAEGYPSVEYGAVMAGEAGLRAWLEAVQRHGFAFVEGVPAEIEATTRLVQRIGYIRETIFGGLWDFTADLKHSDTAYTNLEIGLHTDGTYSLDPPGLQVFHCLAFDGSGGESLLADGFKACADLRRDDPAAFKILTQVEVPARYIEPGVHLGAQHPAIGLDATGRVRRVCYNPHDRAPFLPPPDQAAAFVEALRAFGALVNDPARQQRFSLAPGRVLVFDNWRVLHGRTAYSGRRHLAGCYINREDFESRLRVLRASSGAAAVPGAA